MRYALAFLSVLLLAACAGEPLQVPRTCPQVAVVRDLALLERYDGQRLMLRAGLTNVASGCEYQEGKVRIRAAFNAVARRGDGNTSEKEKAEFFVAVINHKDDVIDKQYDKALWEWSSTDVEKITNEELDITLEGDDLEALSNHRVWLGWNLDDAQLKANREKISKLLRPNG